MASRLKLQTELEELLGSENVYFQPPMSIKMNYPAIVYSLSEIKNKHADNMVYNQKRAYQIIVVDKNPDSMISDKISMLPYCKFSRSYTADNLNHFVYILYY